MGTTFTNLQIKTCDQNILEEQLTSEFYYLQTAEEWYTVLEKDGEHDFDRMTKLGQQLSKTTEAPVLLVHYFDDDVFELHLLNKGNKLGSYQTDLILLEEALGENIRDSNIIKDMSVEERREKLMVIDQGVTCIGNYN